MRAIHAVRELNDSREEPIRVIALYSESERHALFVRQADERYCIGPASAYLDYEALERALTETKADAAWVGWGFVAEHPAFSELCDRLGIVFAGPGRRGDAQARRQDRGQEARRAGRRAGGAVERRVGRQRRGRPADRLRARLPADDQGGRGRRRARHAARGEGGRGRQRLRARPLRGRPGVRRRLGADGAPRRVRAPRRGPAPGRRAGHRVGARRARLLLPAPPPEGRGGVGQPGAQRRAVARAGASRRPSSPARSATAAPPPSSSSTSPSRSSSPSWRSTPGCRSSTPSPRS